MYNMLHWNKFELPVYYESLTMYGINEILKNVLLALYKSGSIYTNAFNCDCNIFSRFFPMPGHYKLCT